MNEHVILFCNLEHLPPHDIEGSGGSPGKWAFGLNLSIGINDQIPGITLDALRPFMQPWTWPQISQVKVRVKDGAGGRTTIETVAPLKWKGQTIDCGHCANEQTAIRPDLDAEYARSKALDFEAFKWQPNGVLGKTSPARSRPWHTFVGQLSTNPAPFPQCLKLSFIFFVDKITTLGPKSVFAAPVLPNTSGCPGLSLPFGAKLLPNGDAPPEWPGHTGIFQWEYVTDTGGAYAPKLIAYMAECNVRLPGARVSAFLDLDSQWVAGNLPGEHDLFDEDWRTMLEDRMADGLDLGQRIIEYLRSKIDDASILPQLKLFQWAAIASFRDMAGVGIHPGPDKKKFIDLVLKTTDDRFPGITDTEKDNIELKVVEKFGNLTEWLLFIAKHFPEVLKLSVMSPPRAFNNGGVAQLKVIVPEEQTTVSDVVAELEQLHKVIFDPKNLAILLREQWRMVCPGVLNPVAISLIEKADLDAFNVRHNLARENFGDLWTILRGMPSTRASGQDIVNQNFSCLFQEYFCKRFKLSLASLTVEIGGSVVACDTTGISSSQYRIRQPDYATDFEMPGPVAHVPFPMQPIRDALVGYIKDWSKTFAATLLPVPSAEPTIVPHAVTMQVDALAGRPQESAVPEERDILKRIAGIGVLMRRKGSAWRCLNMARAYDKSGATLIADPVLVPSRLNYRNELLQAFLSYNNQPLTARSPLTEDQMTPVKVRLPDEANMTAAQQNEVNAPPLLSFKYSEDNEARLPGLEFGQDFEILPFMVANCGALPKALLSDDTSKRSPIEASIATFDASKLSSTDRGKIRPISYRRKVRVGSIRVFDDKGSVSLKMPPIPETVFPRLRDIHRAVMDPANTVAKRDPAEHPMLLLAPPAWVKGNSAAISSFGFCIRKPATDINTWDRWIASSMATAKRSSVWADFYRQSESKRKQSPSTGVEKFQLIDTSIDDPSTTNQFLFELWRIDGASSTPITTKWVLVVVPTAAQNLGSVQSQLMHVTCTCEVGSTETIIETTATINGVTVKDVKITVKPEEVYQLNIFASVLKTDYTAKFANVISEKKEVTDPSGNAVYLMSPFSMLVETATERLIEGIDPKNVEQSEQRLWELLNTGFGLPNHPGAIVVDLAPTTAPNTEGFHFLHRAELLRQVWRWQGRETPLHPLLSANFSCANINVCKEIDEWEAWEFGNRFDTDHLVQDMTTQPPTKLGGRKFFYKEVLEGGADTDELRALHYRFGARVFSRYAGIMPTEVSPSLNLRSTLETRSHLPLAGNEMMETRWRRLFVPCRRKKDLPIPKVKLILPLTESFGDEVGNTAGLLVVLNEPWYQEAGLGEGIAAEVQLTPAPQNDPNHPGDKDTFFFELGTDPVVLMADRGYQQSKDPASQVFDEVCLNQRIRGPVGHTFDRTNESPLFTATSFIIPAPTIFSTKKGGPKEKLSPDLAWDFCRLRLRRVVALSKDVPVAADCNLVSATREVTNCDQPKNGSQLVGPFTDPYWVQYLPEFTHFAPADKKLSDARLKLDNNKGSIQLSVVDRGGQRIHLSPEPSTNLVFELYLVLTRRVFDATGRPDQEVYLEVFHPAADDFWETAKPNVSSDSGLRARIIEVQRRHPDPKNPLPQFDSGDKLWRALFGPKSGETAPTDSELARIVRISPPIESVSSTLSDC